MARKKKSDAATPDIQQLGLLPMEYPVPQTVQPAITPSTLPRLTLLQIDEELYALLKLEEEMLKEPNPNPESLAVIRNEIGQYASRGEAKVNAIATTHATCLISSDICKRHAAHYSKMARRWLSQAESIESSILHTMLLTGSNEYKSAEHRLVLVENGGMEPLEGNLEVMKKESPGFVKVLVEMSLEHWETVKLFNEEELRTAVVKEAYVDNAGTRAVLKDGKTVIGARLLPRGNRVKIE